MPGIEPATTERGIIKGLTSRCLGVVVKDSSNWALVIECGLSVVVEKHCCSEHTSEQ